MSEYHYKNPAKPAGERAADLLSRMTLTEKVGQMSQRLYGFSSYERKGEEVELSDEFKEEVLRYSGLGTLYGLYRADPWSGRTKENGLTGKWAIRAYNTVQRFVMEHSRLGIPVLMSTECPHGHQALDGYLLPVNLAMGATFSPELVEKAYEVCGDQLKNLGIDLSLISMLDVLRDPRWGRSEECFSEDPFLCSQMAKAAVRGMQSRNVVAVAKHFAAQGEGTGGINASAARIGERELRDIHLPPMKACCEEGVGGVMAAYNEIDGIPCHGSKWLLQDVLREEMGFTGLVMSDGVAADRLDLLTGDPVSSGAMAVNAGVDLDLWNRSFSLLEEAVSKGLVSGEKIDEVVLRILTLKFERGLFENPYLEESAYQAFDYDTHPESLNLARESVVLLKNEAGLLPLTNPDKKKIAVIGPNADAIYNQLGDYTPPVDNGVTVYEGIRTLGSSLGFDVCYARGCGLAEGSEHELEAAVHLASECDTVILVLGGSSSRFEQTSFDTNGAALPQEHMTMDCGEGVDTDCLELPAIQNRLTELVCAANKRCIVIAIAGRPYAISKQAALSQALLMSFYPGPMGGTALAELLFGKYGPSGRLPVSIPASTGKIPAYYNYKISYDAPAPLYPFGDGLSYDTPVYSDFELCRKGSFTELTFTVQNPGSRDTAAVPLLFVKHLQSSVIPRQRELKAFRKVWLAPGEAKAVTIPITETMLSVWTASMNFKAEPGEKEILVYEGKSLMFREKFMTP